MPSEQGLNDVIVEKKREIDSLLSTINAHKKEIESLANQTRIKRAELKEQARQTVADLEASIPILDWKIADKTREIDGLDKVLKAKNAEIAAANQSNKDHYEALEKQIKAEYAALKADINRQSAEITSLAESVKLREIAVDEQKRSIAVREQAVVNAKVEIEAKIMAFEAEKAKDLQAISIEKHKIAAQSVIVRNEAFESSAKRKQLDDREAVLDKKEAQADEILERINEANEILEVASQRQAQVEARQVALNELNVKILADNKRLNARASALDEREKKLAEREKNLQALEAQVCNG